MEEKVLTEKESLALITGMITKAKNHYHESGSSALLWGFANVICFVLAYLQEENWISLPFNPFWLMIIAVILQVYFSWKERASKRTVTFKDETHYYVWLAFGISILILTVAGGFSEIGYIVLPLILLLFGIPTFISGCIKKFKPLIFGGIVCWILSVISFFFRENEVFLLVAMGAFFAWVIPGFILRKNYYKIAGI
ncbi:MAG: hypothetical protein ABIW47_15235 [Ginsengibacter sp.]|jgi:hypothetical protein